jgi:predicted dehydrogenase
MAIEDSLRVGVIGSGKMGLLHACLLKIMPNVELAAVCEKSAWTRRFVKRVFRNIPVVKDVSELARLNLDVIYVTTPTPSHFGVVRQVFEEKLARNIFVEKPLTSDYSDSKEICGLASRNGGVNMVGYLRRFMVTFMKTKDLLSQGIIGEPVSFAVNAFSSDFSTADAKPEAAIARGGVMNDLGCYAVDLALWFFGDMQITSAKIESLTGAGSEDAAYFNLQQEARGLEGAVAVSWSREGYRMPEVDLLIKGSAGAIEVNDDKMLLNTNDGVKKVWYRHDLDDRARFWLGAPEYYREDAYFMSKVAEESRAEPSFENALNVDLLIDKVRRSADNLD